MDNPLMNDYGTIFDEKQDTSVIEELRVLYAHVTEIEEKLDLSQKENCKLRREQEDFDQCELQLAEAITDAEEYSSKLEELWKRLFIHIKDDPWVENDFGARWCFFCGDDYWKEETVHKPDCIWVEAKKMLELANE